MAEEERVLTESQAMLDELLSDVRKWEGNLSGGEKLDVGAAALLGLQETDVSFGDPSHRLAHLDEDLFAQLKIELDPIAQQQLGNFDFYTMTLTASLFPKRGAQFQLVECRLTFPEETAIIHSIFPEPRWHKVLEWGGSAKLGMNGNLEWEVGVPGNEIEKLTGAGGLPDAGVKTENEMSSYITVPSYSFDMGRAEITATGVGNSKAIWRLQQPDLKEGKEIAFVLVFKVPAGTEEVELVGLLSAEPKMAWLTEQVDHVFGALKERFQALFDKDDEERAGAERLPIGAHERWTLQLPRGEQDDN